MQGTAWQRLASRALTACGSLASMQVPSSLACALAAVDVWSQYGLACSKAAKHHWTTPARRLTSRTTATLRMGRWL